MSGPENFVARWSRRKRRAAKDPADDAHVGADLKPTPTDTVPAAGAVPPFDVASLPPIESITALTDIRAFLAPGVPPELTRAALRRAWAADPKIRDFVGFADYDWDFNAPGAMAGFGPLELSDELRRHLTEMVGRAIVPKERQEAVPAAVAAPASEKAVEPPAAPPAQASVGSETKEGKRGKSAASRPGRGADVAMQNNEPTKPGHDQLVVRRTHGRALPR
jgi:hypothetical protein